MTDGIFVTSALLSPQMKVARLYFNFWTSYCIVTRTFQLLLGIFNV